MTKWDASRPFRALNCMVDLHGGATFFASWLTNLRRSFAIREKITLKRRLASRNVHIRRDLGLCEPDFGFGTSSPESTVNDSEQVHRNPL